jgi:acyl carrier protein
MSKELFQIISNVLSTSISNINNNTKPEDIESWDSFNGLVLVDELESFYKIKFTLDEVLDVKKVSDIKKHLSNHGVKID